MFLNAMKMYDLRKYMVVKNALKVVLIGCLMSMFDSSPLLDAA